MLIPLDTNSLKAFQQVHIIRGRADLSELLNRKKIAHWVFDIALFQRQNGCFCLEKVLQETLKLMVEEKTMYRFGCLQRRLHE